MSRAPKQPYVRFFASDWLGGTRGMKASEVGVYITLIAMMYERCEPLPEDHRRLARQCGCSPSSFAAILAMLTEDEKIIRVNGGLWNKRVQKEFDWRSENSQQSREAAQARWEKTNKINDDEMRTHSERNANGMPIQNPEFRIQIESSLRSDSESNLNGHELVSEVDLFSQTSSEQEPARDDKRQTDSEIDRIFERDFWPARPRRAGSNSVQRAKIAFRKAIRSGHDPGMICSRWRDYARLRAGQEPKYTLQAATWLNNKGWNDDDAETGHEGLNGHQNGHANGNGNAHAGRAAEAIRGLDIAYRAGTFERREVNVDQWLGIHPPGADAAGGDDRQAGELPPGVDVIPPGAH